MRELLDKLKTAIIVLAILLGISMMALAGTLIYKHFVPSMPASVIVPDNIITPDTEIEESSSEVTNSSTTVNTTADRTTTDRTTTAISLYNSNAGDNVPFNAGNMFPGDAETKYFCVQVSYQDTVTVKYHANIRAGYEKMAEVMKCRIVLLNTGVTLYDGLMRDMPASLDHSLNSTEGTTSELYYEITACLNTSVGNEYQNKSLIADFHWWVEEEGNLIEAPKTGDDSNIFLWTGLFGISLFLLILLWMKQKKEVQNE